VGGTNGLTNFSSFLGMRLGSQDTKLVLFYISLCVLTLVVLLCLWITSSRLGKILIAIRDGENRFRFTGYNPVVFKVFIYSLSAGLAGLAGVLFVLQCQHSFKRLLQVEQKSIY
jgi:urea transport system permease protein